MKAVPRTIRYLGFGTTAILCGVLAGVILSVTAKQSFTIENPSARKEPQVVQLSGRIPGLPSLLGALTTDVVVVLMREGDWSTCEDVGRQLRELRHVTQRRGLRLFILTDSSSYGRFAVRVERENIRPDRLYAVNLGVHSAGLSNSATPAALRVSPSGDVVIGIAHVGTTPGYRTHSFTQELGLSNR